MTLIPFNELTRGRHYLGFTKKRTFISRAIAAYAPSKHVENVSHVFIGRPCGIATEARGEGRYSSVIETPIDKILSDPDLQCLYIAIPHSLTKTEKEIEVWCDSKEGTPYDYFNLLGIQIPNRWVPSVFQRTTEQAERKYVCSEIGVQWISLYVTGGRTVIINPISEYNPSEVLDISYTENTVFALYRVDLKSKMCTLIN